MAPPRPRKKAKRSASRAKAKPKPTKKKPATKKARVTAQAKAVSGAPAGDSGLREGDRAPAFSLPDETGATFSSAALAGEPYVLYFYPKDDTPGCTKEACGFRDDTGKFRAAGVRVIGVSPDKSESHARFRQKYGLSFTLLSDVDKTLTKAFGVWVKKQNYGREYMGVERSTFLVGSNGKIRRAWRRVRVDGHVAAVLDAAKAGSAKD